MGALIHRLWAGQVPLEIAFWRYAVVYGLLVNLVTSALFYALLLDETSPLVIAVAFALPLPYNLLATVGVWRSAQAFEGPRKWADWAQIVTVLWMLLLSLT
ncbi:MAG: hypothetical protein AAF495_28355 [Pseudomonadota bacterium]